jgi:hypothetical protein
MVDGLRYADAPQPLALLLRANSSNSDPDDMVHLHQGSIRRLE